MEQIVSHKHPSDPWDWDNLPTLYPKDQPNVGKYISPMDPMKMAFQNHRTFQALIFEDFC